MSVKFKLIILTLIAVGTLLTSQVSATHIVGGDISYRCLGNNEFELTLTFTRDCEYGADDAPFDDYAIVAIYDQYFNPVALGTNGLLAIPFTGDVSVETSLENDCEILGYEVCVHQAVYRDTVYLQPKAGGYIFSYQRCCRNSTILNIKDPLETGSTKMIRLTEEAFDACNSSPVFDQWPDTYICTNNSVDFYHTATDPDGDSLAYKLYTPYKGASVKNPRPDRFSEFELPYEELEWADGYSEGNMLGGTPLEIDAKTGYITGIPDQAGQFVVGVLVEEYRDGELLSTVRRDFQYNVRVCLEPPIADFEAPDVLCGESEFEVLFNNTSQNADSYSWQFDFPSIDADKVSIVENPTYIYPNDPTFSGKDTFTVALKAIRSADQCYDIIYKDIIVISDELIADFEYEISDCPDDSLDVILKDLSVGLNPSYDINAWSWTVTLQDGSVLTSSDKDFAFTIVKQNEIEVILEISTSEGCTAVKEESLELVYADILFVASPIAICLGDSTHIISNPNSDWTYTWSPEEGLYFEDINDKSNPVCFIDHDTTYFVTVTDGVCTVMDSVDVIVKDLLDISIDGPDYVCEDSITLVALGGEDGFTVFEWAENADFDPVIAEGDIVSFYINGYHKEYFLRVKEGTGCSESIDSFSAFNNSIDLDYNVNELYCFGMEQDIVLTNLRPDDTLTYTWEASPYIISPLDSNVVTIYSDQAGSFDLVFHVINQYGCELQDTIHVTSNEGPPLVIDATLECDTYKYCFTAFGGEGIDYTWDFGDPDTDTDVSTDSAPCYEYPALGTYTVTVTAFLEECGREVTLTQDIMVPDAFTLMGKDTSIFCAGESAMLSVNPSNFSMNVVWTNEAGDVVGNGIMIEYFAEGEEWLHVVAVDTFGCADSLDMLVKPFEFDITKDNPGTLCYGDTVVLSVYNNSLDVLDYSWDPKDNIISTLDESSITVVLEEDDDFVVTVTSPEHGCTEEYIISVLVSQVDIDIESDTLVIVITKSTTLNLVGEYGEDATILWSTGESTESITVSPETTTEYCVTVTDGFDCTDVACVEVTVIDPACNEEDIFIPNAFSPNDDDDIPDNNDIFGPRGLYLEEIEITVYNRWGEKLFNKFAKGITPEDFETAFWDGTYQNEYLGPDTYAYVIWVLCQDTDEYKKIGNVSIIK